MIMKKKLLPPKLGYHLKSSDFPFDIPFKLADDFERLAKLARTRLLEEQEEAKKQE